MARHSKLKGRQAAAYAAGRCAVATVTALSLLAPSAQTLAWANDQAQGEFDDQADAASGKTQVAESREANQPTTFAEALEQLDAAQDAADKAAAADEAAEADVEERQAALEAAKDALDAAAKEKADAEEAAKGVDTSNLEAAQKKYDELKQPYDELVEQRDAIQSEQQRLYEDAMAARKDYEDAQKNVIKEDTKVSDAEGNLNQKLSLKEFFKYYNSQHALDIFDGKHNMYKMLEESGKGNLVNSDKKWDSMIGKTEFYKIVDAAQPSEIREALNYIREVNDIRKSLGLSELKVTDYLMAEAIINNNWSKYTTDHSGNYSNASENLANGCFDPVYYWYYLEKYNYELDKTDGKIDGKDIYGNKVDINYGHYINIINADWKYVGAATSGTFLGSGLRYCSNMLFADYLDSSAGDTNDETFTVDEWEARLDAWLAATSTTPEKDAADKDYASVKHKFDQAMTAYYRSTLDAKTNDLQLNDAEQKLDAAKSELDAAKAEVGPVADRLETAAENYNNARAALDEATAQLEAAQAAHDPLHEAYVNALADLSVAQANYDRLKPQPFFTDVDYSSLSWYGEAVTCVASRGLVTGYSGTTLFGVGDVLTRAQLATILWRNACPDEYASYDPETAKDTTGILGSADGMYYTAAANWAVKNGVITGFDREDGSKDFAADDDVSFEQLVTILSRLCATSGELSAAGSDLSAFADGYLASDWSRGAFAWAAANGLVQGYDEPTGKYLRPGENVARERVAVVLARAFDMGILR